VEEGQSFQLTHWAENARGLVALLIVLDQFSRNIYRGSPKQFQVFCKISKIFCTFCFHINKGDDLAFRLASAAIDRGVLESIPRFQRLFVIFPLSRQEQNIDAVRRSVHLMERLIADSKMVFCVFFFSFFFSSSFYCFVQEGDNPANAEFYTIGLNVFKEQVQLLEKYGRFPIRNFVLGRESTAAELEYLNSKDRFFSTGN
jgi:uncharacterized protein (DUF924 family)